MWQVATPEVLVTPKAQRVEMVASPNAHVLLSKRQCLTCVPGAPRQMEWRRSQVLIALCRNAPTC